MTENMNMTDSIMQPDDFMEGAMAVLRGTSMMLTSREVMNNRRWLLQLNTMRKRVSTMIEDVKQDN